MSQQAGGNRLMDIIVPRKQLQARAATVSSFASVIDAWNGLEFSMFFERRASDTLAGKAQPPCFQAFESGSAVPTVRQRCLRKIRSLATSSLQQSCECRRNRKRSN